ncbi:MAG: hypothetical protein AB4080_06030 [Trichodesmium sp.]
MRIWRQNLYFCCRNLPGVELFVGVGMISFFLTDLIFSGWKSQKIK